MHLNYLTETCLLEKLGFLTLVIDEQQNIISFSSNWHSLLVNNNLSKRNVRDLVDKAYIDKLTALITDINKAQAPLLLKLTHKEEVWVECRIQQFDDNGKKTFLLVCNDVTHKQIRSRKRSNIIKLFKQASAELSIGYWQYNVLSGNLFWSDEVYKIHHVTKDDYRPTLQTAIDFYHHEDATVIKEQIIKAISLSKGWQQLQLRILTPENELKTIVSSAEVSINEYGEVSEIIGFVHDVSKQEKSRLELDFMATAMIETSVGMAIADPKRTILWVNHAFEKMTGYALDEIKHKALGPILQGPETCSNTINSLRDHLNAGKSVKTRILNYHANGTPYWNELTISPIYRDDQLAYFFAVQNDVTAEVLANQKLAKLNNSLEKEVAERTIELTRLNKHLALAASRDPLTGCMNRRNLKEEYINALAELKHKQNICLILIDIDFFKKINDKFGHLAGDKVLETVASQLSKTISLPNRLFRFGGEEFLIIVSNKCYSQLCDLLTKLKHQISQLKIEYDGKLIPVSISLGATYHDGRKSLDTTIKIADKNLYQAKENGRNQFVISQLKENDVCS